MEKRLFLYIAFLVSMAANAATYAPKDVPNPKVQGQNFYVVNPDNILNAVDVTWLNECAKDLEQKTDVELCVVALESIGDYEAYDFAYELFQTWGIGKKGKNTGVLMFFVLNSHDIRMMTGVGIEGVLPDAKCSKIVHDNMIPAFREGDYGGGLCIGALRVYEICTNGEAPEELLNAKSVTNRGRYYEEDDDTTSAWVVIICGIGIIAFCLFHWWKKKKRCPSCKSRKTEIMNEKIVTAATTTHAGEKIVRYRCCKCGHEWTENKNIPRQERITYTPMIGGGGSSSTFGGGGSSFGGGGSWGGGSTFGGGAGGKW